jgi:hypothetical protein
MHVNFESTFEFISQMSSISYHRNVRDANVACSMLVVLLFE